MKIAAFKMFTMYYYTLHSHHYHNVLIHCHYYGFRRSVSTVVRRGIENIISHRVVSKSYYVMIRFDLLGNRAIRGPQKIDRYNERNNIIISKLQNRWKILASIPDNVAVNGFVVNDNFSLHKGYNIVLQRFVFIE